MANLFDDVIPEAQASAGNLFDDVIPPVPAKKNLFDDILPSVKAAITPIISPVKALADFSASPETRESAVRTAEGVAVSAIEQPVKAGQEALNVLTGQPIREFLEPPGAKSAYHPTIVGIVKEALSANPERAIAEQVPEIERMYKERYGEGLPAAVKKDIFGVIADAVMIAGGIAGLRGAVKPKITPKTGFTIAQHLEGKIPTFKGDLTRGPTLNAYDYGLSIKNDPAKIAALEKSIPLEKDAFQQGFKKEALSVAKGEIDPLADPDYVKATPGSSVVSRTEIPAEQPKPATAPESTFDPIKYADEMTAKQEAARQGAEPTLKQKGESFLMDAKRKLVDFASPIEDVLNKSIKEGAKVPITEHITNQIDRVLKVPTMSGQFIKDNGLEMVIKEVDNPTHLDQYLIAKQAQAVEAQGFKTGRDLAKDAALIKEFAPKYEGIAKGVTAYSQKLLDYSVDSGLVSKEVATILKQRYPDYVPINRIFDVLETEGAFGTTKSIASLGKQTVVRGLKGSAREIESPITSLMDKTVVAMKQGETNKAARMLASYKDLPGNPFDIREVTGNKFIDAKNTFSMLENGVKRVFETRPEIAQAAKALNVQQLNVLGQIFALPVRVARVGITGINLPFVASNIAKDQVTAVINSSNALKTSAANPAVFIKGLFEAVKHGELYDEMVRNGALSTSFDISRNQIRPTIQRIRAGRSVGGRVAYTLRHPGELLRVVEDTISRSEQLTRIQQYAGTKEAALAQGMSPAEAEIMASRAARENTVNFMRRGEWGQVLNSAWLYLNANIQGTRTFVRNARNRPVATSAKVAITVFGPVATATAWNLSDPERRKVYEDISEFEKLNNIVLVSPWAKKNDRGVWEGVYKMPLPQGVNNIASMARRPIEEAYGLDPVAVKDIADALIGTVSPIDLKNAGSTLVPQAIKPTIEMLTNKNLFTGKDIVPYELQKRPVDEQFRIGTSGTARKVGEAIGASPLKIDQFVRGTVGGVGSQVLNLSDKILAGLDIIPKEQIGGQDTLEAIAARFTEARGGEDWNRQQELLTQLREKVRAENPGAKQSVIDSAVRGLVKKGEVKRMLAGKEGDKITRIAWNRSLRDLGAVIMTQTKEDAQKMYPIYLSRLKEAKSRAKTDKKSADEFMKIFEQFQQVKEFMDNLNQ